MIIKKFTSESRISEVLNNPIGSDLIEMIIQRSGLNKALLLNPAVKSLKLKNLANLTRGKVDAAFIEVICKKLNTYSKEFIVPATEIKDKWWKEAVFYQIYPRSFMDSNGDGIGDIRGILSKLPYLKELGVDAIWLSPVYDSPNDDNGYDIRDYKAIMNEFGTMEDFDALLTETHRLGMKLIMDLVLNHTSDEHPWFKQALEEPDSSRREYYFFKKGKNLEVPPNNWESLFSGPAWEYDEKSEEWYLHLFSKKQPDLNWDNPNVRHELYQIINWWIEKGVDGFRLDVINFISKADDLPDGNEMIASLTGISGVEHYFFGPRVHQYLREMYHNTFENHDIVTVGETPGIGLHMSRYFTDESRNELNLVFNFDHLETSGKSRFDDYEYDLNQYKEYAIRWQTEYSKSCRNTLFYNNHDNPRMISKITKDLTHKDKLAKMLALMQFTLNGTPFIYQGDEIGMVNTRFEGIEDFRDVESINMYHALKNSLTEEELLNKLRSGSRDHARTPMQWDSGPNAGFSIGQPWIGVNPDYVNTNAADNLADENSILNFYKKIIQIRKNSRTLIYGDFAPVRKYHKNIFAYYRADEDRKYYVEINLSAKETVRFVTKDTKKMLLSNYDYHNEKMLLPYEASIFEIIAK